MIKLTLNALKNVFQTNFNVGIKQHLLILSPAVAATVTLHHLVTHFNVNGFLIFRGWYHNQRRFPSWNGSLTDGNGLCSPSGQTGCF